MTAFLLIDRLFTSLKPLTRVSSIITLSEDAEVLTWQSLPFHICLLPVLMIAIVARLGT